MKIWTLVIILICAGCAGRKVKVQSTVDPSYTSKYDYKKAVNGSTYAVRIFNQDSMIDKDVVNSIIENHVRSELDGRDFKFVESVTDASVLILITTNSKNSTREIPAHGSWGFANGAGGGGFTGGYTANVMDEWMTLKVLDCGTSPQPKVISSGTSWPRGIHDEFLRSEDRIEIAISKLVKGSALVGIKRLSDRRPSSAAGCTD
jgi:hypothetical protein